MGAHSIDWSLLVKWRKPAAIVGVCLFFMGLSATESWYFNYHRNKIRIQDYKKHGRRGLMPPYRVVHNPETEEYTVIWESFRQDVH